jgi:hypothetical protein
MAKEHDGVLEEGPTAILYVHVPVEVHEWLEEEAIRRSRAAGRRVSMSAIVRKAVERERELTIRAAQRRKAS